MIEKVIVKKENKKELSYEELENFFNSYLNDLIDDKDMTRLLKAICKNDLSDKEIISLTDIFIKSGDVLNLESLGVTIDKHSTGGVGDKTTLILGPIISALGLKMPKMSGRGLGHTGGTIDKLESINVDVNLEEEYFINGVKEVGFAITSQTKNLCPMDKKVYALRDVTNTTENIGLIASSIMSKKIASGANYILIDLKVGKGALIKNKKQARRLANIMIKIGRNYNREVRCILTKMDNPLGNNIGNLIEIKEVIDILENKVSNNLSELVITMASNMLNMVNKIPINEAELKVRKVLNNKEAYNKFIEFVNYQKGSIDDLELDEGLKIYSNKKGYITSIDAKKIGEISMALGAGRRKKEDEINYKAGIIINKNVSSYVEKGDLLCTLYGNYNKNMEKEIYKTFKYGLFTIKKDNLIIDIIK